MIFCDYCGKEQTKLEYIAAQCNNCDPFEGGNGGSKNEII